MITIAIAIGCAVLIWPKRSNSVTGKGGRLGSFLWRAANRLPVLRRGKAESVVPVLDALSAAMAAGLSHAEAVSMAVRASPVLTRDPAWAAVIEDAAAGKPLASSWARLARRTGDTDVAALGRAWRVSEKLGCPLADAVRSCAVASRARGELRSRISIASAGATATSNLLSLLPLGGLVMAWTLGLGPSELYGSPIAMLSMGLGLVLILVGRVIVSRLVGRVTGRLS